jgi:hypothetical protein
MSAGEGRGTPRLQQLETDPLWAREYDEFVRAVSLPAPSETISFEVALAALRRLLAMV